MRRANRPRGGGRGPSRRLGPPGQDQGQARSIESQVLDVLRIGLELAALDALDDIGEHRVGAHSQAKLLALAYHEAVEELDLGAPAFLHVLAHRGPLARSHAARVLETLLVAGAHRVRVALAGACDRLGLDVQDLLELEAECLADADRLAAHAGREAADR